MSRYQDQTDPINKALAPSAHQKPQSGKTTYLIDERESRYLFYLRETQGDDFAALTAAGYQPQDRNSARAMAHQIRERINRDVDAKSIFNAGGMGLIEWMLALDWIMQQDVKWRTLAIKSWGLVIGAYGQQLGTQGATINVSLLQQSDGHSPQLGLVNVTVDARKPLPEPRDEA